LVQAAIWGRSLVDAKAAFDRAKQAIETGAISMIAPELGPLLINNDGTVRPDAADFVKDIRELLTNGDLMDRMIANAADGAKQNNHVLSVPGDLIYEEMILIISNTSQSFTVRRIAELLGYPLSDELMSDLGAVRDLAVGKQRRLFQKALAGARANLFTPIPPSLVQ
jgi:VCBS repeat-containing protein